MNEKQSLILSGKQINYIWGITAFCIHLKEGTYLGILIYICKQYGILLGGGVNLASFLNMLPLAQFISLGHDHKKYMKSSVIQMIQGIWITVKDIITDMDRLQSIINNRLHAKPCIFIHSFYS